MYTVSPVEVRVGFKNSIQFSVLHCKAFKFGLLDLYLVLECLVWCMT